MVFAVDRRGRGDQIRRDVSKHVNGWKQSVQCVAEGGRDVLPWLGQDLAAEGGEVVRRHSHEPCLLDAGQEEGGWLHIRSRGSGKLLGFAQRARDPEGVVWWRTRNQGSAGRRDLENRKGVGVEERLQGYHPPESRQSHMALLGHERALSTHVVGVRRWRNDRRPWRLVHGVSSCRGGSER